MRSLARGWIEDTPTSLDEAPRSAYEKKEDAASHCGRLFNAGTSVRQEGARSVEPVQSAQDGGRMIPVHTSSRDEEGSTVTAIAESQRQVPAEHFGTIGRRSNGTRARGK